MKSETEELAAYKWDMSSHDERLNLAIYLNVPVLEVNKPYKDLNEDTKRELWRHERDYWYEFAPKDTRPVQEGYNG